MKLAGLPVAIMLIGWIAQSGPQRTQALQVFQRPQATEAVAWKPLTHGVHDIWPTDPGIIAVDVAITPDPASRDGSTVLAVVHWNGDFRAAIYRLRVGLDEDAFADAVAGTRATLTVVSAGPGDAAARMGSLQGGHLSPLPQPHM
jgi:hypothetical protein